MRIIYNDGSELECTCIEISERHLYVDDVYIIHVEDIERIEED